MYRALGSSVPNRVAIGRITPEIRQFHTQHNASITGRSPLAAVVPHPRAGRCAFTGRRGIDPSGRQVRWSPASDLSFAANELLSRGSGSNQGRATTMICSSGASPRDELLSGADGIHLAAATDAIMLGGIFVLIETGHEPVAELAPGPHSGSPARRNSCDLRTRQRRKQPRSHAGAP
jgi:hypothetical protein